MTFPYGVTLTRVRPASPARFGDPGGPADELAVPGCAIWQDTTTETIDGQDTVVTVYRAVMPTGTDIAATDLVQWNDDQLSVVGDPHQDTSPFTGTTLGVQVTLRKVTG